MQNKNRAVELEKERKLLQSRNGELENMLQLEQSHSTQEKAKYKVFTHFQSSVFIITIHFLEPYLGDKGGDGECSLGH